MKNYYLTFFLVISFGALAVSQNFSTTETSLFQKDDSSIIVRPPGVAPTVPAISQTPNDVHLNISSSAPVTAITPTPTPSPYRGRENESGDESSDDEGERRRIVVTPVPTPAPVPVPVAPPATVPTPATKSKGLYIDGTYNGDAITEYYGVIQVAAVITNGKLVDVKFLQYPTDRRTSAMINQQALPQLKSEAIAAQSANIDAVSGASETSPAFIQSLASALSKAKA